MHGMNKGRQMGMFRLSLCALLTAVVAGCAGANVTPGVESAPISNSRPSTIFVYDYGIDSGEVTLNQGFFEKTYRQMSDENQTEQQIQLAHQASKQLAYEVMQQLQGMGFYVVKMARGAQPTGNNVLVVDGQFVDINEGNRLRRMVIGLGSGESNVSTRTQVFQVADGVSKPLMDFSTTANSGKMPGAALTAPAGAAVGGAAAAASLGANLAAGAGKTYTSAVGTMVKRSADQIVAYMSQYFLSQGWITPDQAKRADVSSSD
jgi:Domain of unknown function (DUF4410)